MLLTVLKLFFSCMTFQFPITLRYAFFITCLCFFIALWSTLLRRGGTIAFFSIVDYVFYVFYGMFLLLPLIYYSLRLSKSAASQSIRCLLMNIIFFFGHLRDRSLLPGEQRRSNIYRRNCNSVSIWTVRSHGVRYTKVWGWRERALVRWWLWNEDRCRQ